MQAQAMSHTALEFTPDPFARDAIELELFRCCTYRQHELNRREATVSFEGVRPTISVSGLYRDIHFDNPAPPPEA